MGSSRQEYWSGLPFPSLYYPKLDLSQVVSENFNCIIYILVSMYCFREELTPSQICFFHFNLCFALLLFTERILPALASPIVNC